MRKKFALIDRWRDEALYRFVLQGILKVQLTKLKLKHKRLVEEHEDSMLRVTIKKRKSTVLPHYLVMKLVL